MPRARPTRKRAPPLEAVFEQLEQVSGDPSSRESQAALRAALAHPSPHAVDRAAALVASHALAELRPELEAAFVRLLAASPAGDKNCTGKHAVAVALDTLEATDSPVFREGLRYVQIEATYGPPHQIDTAAGLRAVSAVALAKTRDPEVFGDLVETLVDPERAARVGAAQALGVIGLRESVGVLRLKALIGDADPEVVGECFQSLLAIDAGPSLAFVGRFLAADDVMRETAALALGQSRLEGALELLDACWKQGQETRFARVLLVAMAILRRPAATERLVGIVRAGDLPAAAHALAALAPFRVDPALVVRVEAAVDAALADGAPARLRKLLRETWTDAP